LRSRLCAPYLCRSLNDRTGTSAGQSEETRNDNRSFIRGPTGIAMDIRRRSLRPAGSPLTGSRRRSIAPRWCSTWFSRRGPGRSA
jgi:hypothetical protein